MKSLMTLQSLRNGDDEHCWEAYEQITLSSLSFPSLFLSLCSLSSCPTWPGHDFSLISSFPPSPTSQCVVYSFLIPTAAVPGLLPQIHPFLPQLYANPQFMALSSIPCPWPPIWQQLPSCSLYLVLLPLLTKARHPGSGPGLEHSWSLFSLETLMEYAQ